MQSLALKVAVTALTAATAVAAAVHVGTNVKNASAPLHPGVVGGAASAAPAGSGGRLSLSPSVRGGTARPVTSTYAS